jgi:sialic acid synthase SpsE
LRPSEGISPMKWDQIIGSLAKKNYKKNDLIVL